MRQEKKYILSACDSSKFERRIINDGFISDHKPNLINNIYFDNLEYSCAKLNLEGEEFRIKYRLRWYNESNKFVLEEKIKRSSSGKKNRIQIKSNCLNEALKESSKMISMLPVTRNQYYRRYYRKNDIRITIDSNLKFLSLDEVKTIPFNQHIVEIKYPTHVEPNLQIIKELTKFSKYVMGLQALKFSI